MHADVYEEGDFITNAFGFALGLDVDRNKLLAEIRVTFANYPLLIPLLWDLPSPEGH